MILVIDAGNTNINFAVLDLQGRVVRNFRKKTDVDASSDDYYVWLKPLLDVVQISMHVLKGAVLSSVVPKATYHLQNFCRKYIGFEPLVVGADGLDIGLKINMDNPSEVGGDRIMAALGALGKYDSDVLVIDFGTATTIDVALKNGSYEGGIIAPGLNLSLSALDKATAKLPPVEIIQCKNVIGKNTVQAMQSGIYWGYVSMIEGFIDRLKAELDLSAVKVIATGGMANLIASGVKQIDVVEDYLVLEGLYIFYIHNIAKRQLS